MRRDSGCLRKTLIVALAVVASLFVIGFCISLIADDEASEPTQESGTPKVVERVVTKFVTVEVRVEVTPTATVAKPTESSPTVEPTLELAPSIVRSRKGQSGGQIDLPAGVYRIHFSVTENDRSFAPDKYELTLISRSGRSDPITIEGFDSSARESVRYNNLQDDLLYYEVDVANNGSWQIEIVQTGEALPTPMPATPTPTSTKEADPTSEASPTPAATPTSTPTPLREYEVQVGDTLSAIAERFGVEVSDLISANGVADPNALQVGALLRIPRGNGGQTGQEPSPSLTPTPAPIPTATPTSVLIQMELAELLDEYDQNKVRANTRLRYQENGEIPVSTSGFVSEVEESYVVVTPTQEQFLSSKLYCYYSDTRAALHLTKGQRLSVTGRVRGTDGYSSSVHMFLCEIEGIQLEKKPTVSAQELRENVVQVFCLKGTIFIRVYKGTGIIIDAEEGMILTVHHVVADENDCEKIEVEVPGIESRIPATTVKHCASIDRARLRISPQVLSGLSLQPIYRAAAPAHADQEIFFWGYGPGELRMGTGIVKDVFGENIVTDAYAVPGDSGSPVFDENGHLLGTMSRSNRSDRAVFTGDEC